MLREQGFLVEVMGYDRGLFHGHRFNFPITSLGRIRQGKYLLRIPKLVRTMWQIRSALRRCDLVYVFGADLALSTYCAGLGLGRPIAMEAMDITTIQVAEGLKGRIVRAIDRFIVKRCRLLVVLTAEYYRYFHDRLGVNTPSLIIESKVERPRAAAGRGATATNPGSRRKDIPLVNRPLRIGYFSLVRDQWSLDVLARLVGGSKGKFQAVIAGTVSPRIRRFDKFLSKNPEIEYQGAYRYPDDLPALYGSVDLVMACYPPLVPYCWSRSSRFYESAFYGCPLIVRAGSSDAAEVAQHQIGLVVKHSSPDDAAKEIGAITAADWVHWRDNVASLPSHLYCHTTEAEELALALRGILRSGPS